MEKSFHKVKYVQNLIFVFFIFLLCSCNEKKSGNVFEKAIELTESNEVIKDTLSGLKARGINFVVCFIRKNDKNDILSFNLVHEPGKKFYTYNVGRNFEIETIENVDILYINSGDSLINSYKKVDKKTKELLDKKIITFNGENRFIDCDFIEFVICKKDKDVFKCFNNRMEIDEQNRLYNIGKPYYRESFYPKCE